MSNHSARKRVIRSRDEMEQWLPVAGYEGRYEVSDLGRVRSLPRKHAPSGRVLGRRINQGGYVHVFLYGPGGPRNHLVHRLVCLAFLGEPPADRRDVNHKDGAKANNRLSNLEWSNDSLNVSHAIRELGTTPPPGCRHWLGKFDADHISSKPVVRTSPTGETKRYPSAASAAREGFSFRHISAVCHGKRPRHRGYSWRFEEQA